MDKLAGICGASNLNIKSGETNGMESCRYSTASLEVASNRIQDGSCPQLEQPIKEELEKEKGQCAKVKVTLTKVRFIRHCTAQNSIDHCTIISSLYLMCL